MAGGRSVRVGKEERARRGEGLGGGDEGCGQAEVQRPVWGKEGVR